MTDENTQSEEADYISKTQLKKHCDDLKKLGEDLINLKTHELEMMHMPEQLEEAVAVARKLNARSGLKRQKQYIGKIMREIDSADIEQQLNKIKHRNDASNASFKKTEHWRDRLILQDNNATTELLGMYPEMDRQHLHQLIRQAKKEAAAEKPPAAARKLFRYLREFIDPES